MYPTMIPAEQPTAAIQNGIAGGSINPNNNPVTKKPSLIRCFKRIAQTASVTQAVTQDTASNTGTRKPKK